MHGYFCTVCRDYWTESERALRLHLIRHGPAVIARTIGRGDLARYASWSYTLRRAVGELAKRGAVL